MQIWFDYDSWRALARGMKEGGWGAGSREPASNEEENMTEGSALSLCSYSRCHSGGDDTVRIGPQFKGSLVRIVNVKKHTGINSWIIGGEPRGRGSVLLVRGYGHNSLWCWAWETGNRHPCDKQADGAGAGSDSVSCSKAPQQGGVLSLSLVMGRGLWYRL